MHCPPSSSLCVTLRPRQQDITAPRTHTVGSLWLVGLGKHGTMCLLAACGALAIRLPPPHGPLSSVCVVPVAGGGSGWTVRSSVRGRWGGGWEEKGRAKWICVWTVSETAGRVCLQEQRGLKPEVCLVREGRAEVNSEGAKRCSGWRERENICCVLRYVNPRLIIGSAGS